MVIDIFTRRREFQELNQQYRTYLILRGGLIFAGSFVLVSRGLIFLGHIFGGALYLGFHRMYLVED